MLVSDAFDRTARAAGSRIAVVEGGGALAYEGLLSWSEAVTEALHPKAGLAGRRVAMMLPNSAGFAATFFGIARAGGVVAPLNVNYREQELGFFLEDIDPAAVVVAPEAADRVMEAASRLARPPRVLLAGAPGEIEELAPGSGAETTASEGEDPVLLLYTSGSTGRPKRVVRNHAQLAAEVECLLNVFDVSREDRFLGAAPFSHVNGLCRTMLTSMIAGATLFPVPKYSRRPVLGLLAEQRITFFGAVPHMFILLTGTRTKEEARLSLRLAFCSSAPLPAGDNRAFAARFGIWVRQLYGSSETGTMSYNTEEDPSVHAASVGTPLPGVEILALCEEGGIAAPGEEGEIAIRSPFAITAYEGNREATAKSFSGGRYLSGDLGTVGADGFVTLTGRKSLMINRGGFKVNPYEVEEALLTHPGIAEAAVVGAPGEHGDQIVRAVIVGERGLVAGEVVRYLESRIAAYKIPSRVEFADSLPKSAAGKVLRTEL